MNFYQNFLGRGFVRKLSAIAALFLVTHSSIAQNNSLDFNGSGYIEVTGANTLLSGSDFTIETMLNISAYPSGGWAGFIGYQASLRSPSMWVVNGTGGYTRGLHYDSYPSGGGSRVTGNVDNVFPDADTWYHVAWVKEATEYRFYIDGELVHTHTGIPVNVATNSSYNVGLNDNHIEGFMDEVRIWSVARTQAEIQANMNLELTGSETGLDLYFNFNEGSGTSATDLTGNYGGNFNGGLDATDWLTSGAFTTWDNSGTTDWTSSSNWSNGVPGASSENVGIPAGGTQPEVSGTITVNNLSMAEGASLTVKDGGTVTANGNTEISNNATLTIEPNGQLTVGGNMNVNGAEAIVIQSDANGTGNLAHTGTDISYLNSGTVKVQRYLSGHASDYYSGFHYLSSPVSGHATFGDMASLYAYRESDLTWLNHLDGADGFSSFTPGQGYAIRYTSNVTKEFVGQLNDGDINIAITHTANAGNAFEYFNLVGNPYPSSINAAAFRTANSGLIDPTISLWNGVDYATYNTSLSAGTAGGASIVPDGNLAVGQAFFVKSTAAGSLSFTNAMRNTDSDQFFRKKAEEIIRINLSNQDHFNQLIVASHEEATEGIDEFDSEKIQGNPMMSFYSLNAEKMMSIQTVPSISTDRVVQLGLEIAAFDSYEIALDDKSIFDGAVYLWDAIAKEQVNLKETSYTVGLDKGSYENRFKLLFAERTVAPSLDDITFDVYVADDMLRFDISQSLTYQKVALYSVNGQLLRSWKGNGSYDVSDLNSGAYIVKVKTNEGASFSAKLLFVK